MKTIKRGVLLFVVLLLLMLLVVGAYGYWGLDQGAREFRNSRSLGERQQTTEGTTNASLDSDKNDLLSRGAYLVKQANCAACHTAIGGKAFAGGRVLRSEFGSFVTPNITPDKDSGIGTWTFDDFWNALHNGKGKDGRLLYPAFPFENYTHITKADADAMWAYLQTVPAISQRNAAHELRFPYDQRWMLAWWRAMSFRPGALTYVDTESSAWNRGAYLVRGLAHCSACHSARDSLGGSKGSGDLSGAGVQASNWYAPALFDAKDSELASLEPRELERFLQEGQNRHRAALGTMAEVVQQSLQSWKEADITAMREYLQQQAQAKKAQQSEQQEDFLDRSLKRSEISAEQLQILLIQGEKIYRQHCAECHADDGSGRAGIYPRLKNSMSVQRANNVNLIRVILAGGFPPVTKAAQRPYGMPPFAPFLSDDEVALVATYIRNSWGNKASVVSASEVNQHRSVAVD